MELIERYAQNHIDILNRNDYINPSLYEEYCIFFSLVTLMLMRVYNIDMPVSLFITLWISVCIMAIAKPPIPCGGIICIAYLFTVVGVPPEAISIILCVDPIAAMFNGVCNESANMTTSFIVSKDAGMLDEKKYFSS